MTSTTVQPRLLSDRDPTEPGVSDAALLVRYRDQGDKAAFDELVHRYERELFNYLRRYLADAELAEDVFQATFLQVHQKCHQFHSGRAFRPWLYAIATHQAIDALRKRRRRPAVSFDTRPAGREEEDEGRGGFLQLLANHRADPTAAIEEKERRQWVDRMVHELPPSLRTPVLLVYYQGLKYREVAAILGIPEGTLKSRIHMAVARLNLAWRKRERQEEGTH